MYERCPSLERLVRRLDLLLHRDGNRGVVLLLRQRARYGHGDDAGIRHKGLRLHVTGLLILPGTIHHATIKGRLGDDRITMRRSPARVIPLNVVTAARCYSRSVTMALLK